MSLRRDNTARSQVRQSQRRIAAASARSARRMGPQSRRSVGSRDLAMPFSPPEDWHESTGEAGPTNYRVIVQEPGEGYRHVVTPAEVRDRLAQLPEHFLRDLEVIQFSQVTRKKRSFPCYGMQWGTSLYLYPLEESLVETFYAPPRPSVINEAKMFGGVWAEPAVGEWTLTWSRKAIKDFYLNNILIHELGHLLDDRNNGYTDRERFAEWFAIEFGYRPTGGDASRRPKRKVVRRHG